MDRKTVEDEAGESGTHTVVGVQEGKGDEKLQINSSDTDFEELEDIRKRQQYRRTQNK